MCLAPVAIYGQEFISRSYDEAVYREQGSDQFSGAGQVRRIEGSDQFLYFGLIS
ncbi:MAG: hypothetical protein JWQ35_1742 [Bacteriovoracaceae bacterium]|nr:hypothetical protein [Bacteriovoracaceae bacterium]